MNRILASCAVAIVAFVLAGAAPLAASERSQILSSRGLIEFHAARFDEALALFEQAVAVDAQDTTARYYRAATHARLKDYDRAIVDLRAVLAIAPENHVAALDLGVALIETGQHAEAVPWLEQAQRSPELSARASLFLGLAQLRQHQPKLARRNFELAAANTQQRVTARYYEGVAAYEDGDLDEARVRFEEVLAATPDSAIGRESSAFLERIAGRGGRWWRVRGGTGLQYDSNVILAPSSGGGGAEEVLAVSGQADGRATFAAGVGVTPLRTHVGELSAGYDFFQSVHFELHDFDVQAHSATAQISGGGERLRFGVAARYDYYLLDWSSFLQEAAASPWMMVGMGEVGHGEVYYRMRRRDYKQLSYQVRDAYNHATGLRQVIYLGKEKRYLAAGYQFDFEDPIADPIAGVFSRDTALSFGYTGHELNAAVGWQWPAAITTELGYIYRHERYASQSKLFIPTGARRHDDEHEVLFSVRKALWKHIEVVAGYLGDFNTSKDVRFDYDRHIVSISLEVSF